MAGPPLDRPSSCRTTGARFCTNGRDATGEVVSRRGEPFRCADHARAWSSPTSLASPETSRLLRIRSIRLAGNGGSVSSLLRVSPARFQRTSAFAFGEGEVADQFLEAGQLDRAAVQVEPADDALLVSAEVLSLAHVVPRWRWFPVAEKVCRAARRGGYRSSPIDPSPGDRNGRTRAPIGAYVP